MRRQSWSRNGVFECGILFKSERAKTEYLNTIQKIKKREISIVPNLEVANEIANKYKLIWLGVTRRAGRPVLVTRHFRGPIRDKASSKSAFFRRICRKDVISYGIC